MRALCDHFEEIVGGALLSAMFVIGAIQVVSRYALTFPLAWTEEAATTLFSWMVFIGASLALKKEEHFAIDAVAGLLPARRGLRWLRILALLAFCLLTIFYGAKLVAMNWDVPTSMLEISTGWAYLSLPFGGLLMLCRTVEMALRTWTEGRRLPEPPITEGAE